MSSALEIQDVHQAETKFKLKPHLAATRPVNTSPIRRGSDGLLRVSLAELLSEEAIIALMELGLLR